MKAKIILVLFFGFGMSACEMLTEPDPDNQFTTERIFRDPAFAEGILLRGYRLLPTDYSFEEVATDDAVSNERGNSYLRMATGEWSPQFNPLDNWGTAYDAIFNLNYFLSVVNDVEWSWQSAERNGMFRDRFTGEALALRGYFYFKLLERFGGVGADGQLLGVPLVTEVIETDDNWELPRASYEECISQIQADLDEALVLLPYVWANQTTGDNAADALHNRTVGSQNQNRINGKIVRALKAKVALHAASPAFNPDGSVEQYVSAAQESSTLIKELGGLAGLTTGGLKFYDADGDITNAEIFWRGDHYTNNTRELANYPPSMFGNGRVNPSQNLVDAFPMKNGLPISDPASGFNPAAPYANRDPRLAAYIIYDGNRIGTTAPVETDVASPVNGINKTPDFSTRTGYYLLKLLRPDVNLTPTAINTRRHFYTHIRYTELFLIYAEAANEAYGPDDANTAGFSARQVIQTIRQRAAITQPDNYLASVTTKDEMRELIRNERRLELCFEGFRFWDLRRWEKNLNEPAKAVIIDGTNYNYVDVESRAYPSHAKYGPIPFTETLKYGGLVQNEGW
jgi:starch-binding outer membrane protein, SusD/RagB family